MTEPFGHYYAAQNSVSILTEPFGQYIETCELVTGCRLLSPASMRQTGKKALDYEWIGSLGAARSSNR